MFFYLPLRKLVKFPLQIGTFFGFLCTVQEQSSILPTIEWWIRKVTLAKIVQLTWKNLLVKKCRSVHSQISISHLMIFLILFSKNLILNKNCFQKKKYIIWIQCSYPTLLFWRTLSGMSKKQAECSSTSQLHISITSCSCTHIII